MPKHEHEPLPLVNPRAPENARVHVNGQPAASRLPHVDEVIAGKYRILRLLGEGGMGAVFEAEHLVMGKRVALKWLRPELVENPEARQRFVQEARTAAAIQHPNVVDVHDVGNDDESLYMVMELLAGHSLEALLANASITAPETLAVVTQALQGVAAAHARGIVHRDIKPDNIFVGTGGDGQAVVKVLDFGISKLLDEHNLDLGITRTGTTIGTPSYMSIEQIRGAKDVDARTDVYAFGVILYRAFTGRLPFDGETFGALAVDVATTTPPSLTDLQPSLSQRLNDLVMKAMARDRDDRFAHAGALLEALQHLDSQEEHGRALAESRSAVSPTEETVLAQSVQRDTYLDAAADTAPVSGARPSRGAQIAIAAATLALGAALSLAFGRGSSELPKSRAEAGVLQGALNESTPVSRPPRAAARRPRDEEIRDADAALEVVALAEDAEQVSGLTAPETQAPAVITKPAPTVERQKALPSTARDATSSGAVAEETVAAEPVGVAVPAEPKSDVPDTGVEGACDSPSGCGGSPETREAIEAPEEAKPAEEQRADEQPPADEPPPADDQGLGNE